MTENFTELTGWLLASWALGYAAGYVHRLFKSLGENI